MKETERARSAPRSRKIGRPPRIWACLLAAALAGLPGVALWGEEEPLLVPDRIKADLMVILAHPDDEGVVAPLLARYALEEKRRIVSLYLTAGQFGTNRVGEIRGPAFGYLRLAELHWTLDRLGVAISYSLDRTDQALTEDPAEVLDSWDRERTLRELTRYIRLVRPERVITWFPGPASSHVDHVAAGGAALLACRAAASPEAFPEQMMTEGLRPHRVGEVLLATQAEKVAYERYPSSLDRMRESGVRIEEIPVDEYSAALGRRYTDIAREAMKEQRSVGAAANLGRDGPFDEPLILVHAFGPGAGAAPAPRDAARRVRIAPVSSGSQRFLEQIAEAVEAPGLAGVFWPEARLAPAGATEVAFRIVNDRPDPLEARARIEAPPGWSVRPSTIPLSLAAGEATRISWRITPSRTGDSLFAAADVRLVDPESRAAILSETFVLRRSDPGTEPAAR